MILPSVPYRVSDEEDTGVLNVVITVPTSLEIVLQDMHIAVTIDDDLVNPDHITYHHLSGHGVLLCYQFGWRMVIILLIGCWVTLALTPASDPYSSLHHVSRAHKPDMNMIVLLNSRKDRSTVYSDVVGCQQGLTSCLAASEPV